MKKLHLFLLTIVIAGILVSCNSGGTRRNPGKAYAMDMTYARAYDYYNMYDPTDSSMGHPSRLPVSGTIARGHELPDHLREGDSMGYETFTTSMRFNAAELKEGGRLFNIYCGICHGTGLDGNGPLYADGNGKFAAKPANFMDAQYKAMHVGRMYAAVKFGKNMMGSYASQLDIRQRWMVIAYIKQKQAGNGNGELGIGGSAAPAAPADSTATASAGADSTTKK